MSARQQSPAGWPRSVARRVQADGDTVFNLLAEVSLWPALFRHILSAQVLRRDGRRRLIAIRAAWYGVPVSFVAIQTVDPDARSMTIQHVSRLTRGSVATWAVVPVHGTDGEVVVRVDEQIIVPAPVVGSLLARSPVGERLARDLGEAMLDRLKAIAEGGSLAGRE